MNKTTRKIVSAFLRGKSARLGNTSTNGYQLFLFGNQIAQRDSNGDIITTLAGWPTATTREHLNGLCELMGFSRGFYQSDGQQYYQGRKIDEHDKIRIPYNSGIV